MNHGNFGEVCHISLVVDARRSRASICAVCLLHRCLAQVGIWREVEVYHQIFLSKDVILKYVEVTEMNSRSLTSPIRGECAPTPYRQREQLPSFAP